MTTTAVRPQYWDKTAPRYPLYKALYDLLVPHEGDAPTVVSLFSGAGGFDWGFHRAGFKTVLAFELLADAAKTLACNLNMQTVTPSDLTEKTSAAVVNGNIEDVDFSLIKVSPDVLIGGPPCQDFSVSKAHERQGLNGGRGHLYREFVRAVMYLQPKVFVFENVPGLISANKGQAYHTILSDLRHLEAKRKECIEISAGYAVPQCTVENYVLLHHSIVEAADLGVPQIRRRLIIIGVREDLFNSLTPSIRAEFSHHLRLSMAGHVLPFSRYPLTSLEVFEGRPLPELQQAYESVLNGYRDLANGSQHHQAVDWLSTVLSSLSLNVVEDYLRLNQMSNAFSFSMAEFERAMQEHEELLAHLGWLGKPVADLEPSDGTHLPVKQSPGVLARMYHIPPDENANFVKGTPWEVESKDISFIYRRTAPLKPALTVMAYGGGGTHGYHYDRQRTVLTLRERARIQTFTDDFLFQGLHVRAQIGEAVPPLLGERIAQALRPILDALPA